MTKTIFAVSALFFTSILVASALWFWVLQPLLEPKEIDFTATKYEGSTYYLNKQYLELDNGPLFQAFLTECSAEENGTLSDFYYEDFEPKDPGETGMHYDIIVAEFGYSPEDYQERKLEFFDSRYTIYTVQEDYTLGEFSSRNMSKEKNFFSFREDPYVYTMMAFCDKTCTVRFMMVPDHLSSHNQYCTTSSYDALLAVLYTDYLSWTA